MCEERKGPGRPKLDLTKKRSRHVSVRLTEEEYKQVNKMLEFDESMSDFFRRLFFKKRGN